MSNDDANLNPAKHPILHELFGSGVNRHFRNVGVFVTVVTVLRLWVGPDAIPNYLDSHPLDFALCVLTFVVWIVGGFLYLWGIHRLLIGGLWFLAFLGIGRILLFLPLDAAVFVAMLAIMAPVMFFAAYGICRWRDFIRGRSGRLVLPSAPHSRKAESDGRTSPVDTDRAPPISGSSSA
jgi:hypothetical protein